GVMLFLIAAGLTLVFGIMNFINLAHGSLYMMGAFFAASFARWTGSFVLGVALALALLVILGMVLEAIALRPLYGRDHLDQVLGSFSLILLFNEAAIMIWGTEPQYIATPPLFAGAVELLPGVKYPVLRLAITGFGLAVAAALLVGLVDSMGRFLLPLWLGYQVGPAVASMAIYILMAGVLLWRPQGLFSGTRG